MTYVFLLIIFLIQFLVALGALMFVISLARSGVPFLANGPREKLGPDDRDHRLPGPPEGNSPTSVEEAWGSSRGATEQVMATPPSTLAAFPRPTEETL
jgi:hypothetical protein